MSDLQIILIVIGALIIVAVLILNWWQERRFHQQVESSFSTLQRDALLDDPKLDVSQIQEAEDAFSVDGLDANELSPLGQDDAPTFTADQNAVVESFAVIDEYDSLNKSSIEEVYTEAVYSELEHKVRDSAHYDKTEQTDSNPVEPKSVQQQEPAKHQEIKAIFDEVFSSSMSGKAGTSAKSESAVEGTPIDSTPPLEEEQEEPELTLPGMLHAQMDLIAVLYLASESTVGALNGALNGLFDEYEKPVYVHLLDTNKQWLLLNDAAGKPEIQDQAISRLTCSLQLADRAGAVSRNMLNRFQLAVESLGLDINAHVEWQSSGDALAAANTLDAFCLEVDKTMGFHLVHGDNGAFTGTKLRGLAEAQGLTLSADGTFKYFDESAANSTGLKLPSFVMFNREHHPFSPEMLRSSVVKAVTFQLDIPRVKHCAEAFNHMVQIARQMEIGLNAVLVDDNNRVLSDIQIEKIRQQLKVIHAKLLVKGIVPGSESALRLFS